MKLAITVSTLHKLLFDVIIVCTLRIGGKLEVIAIP